MRLQIIALNISHFYHVGILGDVVLSTTSYFPEYCSRFRCPLVFYAK